MSLYDVRDCEHIPKDGRIGDGWFDDREQVSRILVEIGTPACQALEDEWVDRLEGFPSRVVGWHRHPRWMPHLIEWKVRAAEDEREMPAR